MECLVRAVPLSRVVALDNPLRLAPRRAVPALVLCLPLSNFSPLDTLLLSQDILLQVIMHRHWTVQINHTLADHLPYNGPECIALSCLIKPGTSRCSPDLHENSVFVQAPAGLA